MQLRLVLLVFAASGLVLGCDNRDACVGSCDASMNDGGALDASRDAAHDASAPHDAGIDAPRTTRVTVSRSGTGTGSIRLTADDGTSQLCGTSCVDTGYPGRFVQTEAFDVDESSAFRQVFGPCSSDDWPWECDVTVEGDLAVQYEFVPQASPLATEVRTFSGAGSVGSPRIGRDDAGNVYVFASVSSTSTFSVGSLSAPAGSRAVVFQLDTSGTPVWLRGLTTRYVLGMAVSPAGGVWLAGRCESGDRIAETSFTTNGPCVARLDALGATSVTRGWNTAGTLDVIAVSTSGAVAVGGHFSGTLTADAVSLTSRDSDPFVMAIDPSNGNATWGARFGGGDVDDFPVLVAFGPSDALYVASALRGNGTAGPLTITHANFQWSGFLLAYDASHTVTDSLWLEAGTLQPRALRIAASGDVAIAGEYAGTFELAPELPVPVGVQQFPFVLHTDPTFTGGWIAIGSDGEIADVLPTADGGAYVLVQIPDGGGSDWGGGYLLQERDSVGLARALGLVRLDGEGSHMWSKKLGDASAIPILSDPPPLGQLLLTSTELRVLGVFRHTLTLAPHPTATETDLYLATFPL